MAIKSIAQILIIFAITSFIAACGGNQSGPTDTARAFWGHLMSENPKNAMVYMFDKERESLVFNDWSPDDQIVFGKGTKKDDFISIDTIFILHRQGKTLQIPLKTILVEKNGAWLVDYYSTRSSLYDAVVENMLNNMADKLIIGVDVFESELPQFADKKNDPLHGEIQKYMSETATYLYDGIVGARKKAKALLHNKREGAQALRQRLLEESSQNNAGISAAQ